MYTNPVKILQVDLVSSCNAFCPSCYRQDSSGHLQGHFPQNKHLDLKLFAKALADRSLALLEEVFFCGNYGDPMASPHLPEVIDLIRSHHPQACIYMHTNGGLGKKETWVELGRRLNGRGNFVKFAIDGLEDTNHIYRRKVSWKRVMENARTFIDAGGRAVWKFVIFGHNKHQVEEARRLSQELGFARFETTPNYAPEQEPYLTVQERGSAAFAPEPREMVSDRLSREELEAVHIRCDAKEEHSLFLDFVGSLWPCCWIGGWKYSSNSSLRERHGEYFKQWAAEDTNFNSLGSHSLEEILSHPWFESGLQASWKKPLVLGTSPGATHALCIEKCGGCRG